MQKSALPDILRDGNDTIQREHNDPDLDANPGNKEDIISQPRHLHLKKERKNNK